MGRIYVSMTAEVNTLLERYAMVIVARNRKDARVWEKSGRYVGRHISLVSRTQGSMLVIFVPH